MMYKSILHLSLALLLLTGCNSAQPGTAGNTENSTDMENGPAEFTGIAENRKGGAVVIRDSDQKHIWIEGQGSWGDDLRGKKVLAKGTLVTRDDNPVFLDTGGVIVQGIPVKTEAEYERQKWRTWLTNVDIQRAE